MPLKRLLVRVQVMTRSGRRRGRPTGMTTFLRRLLVLSSSCVATNLTPSLAFVPPAGSGVVRYRTLGDERRHLGGFTGADAGGGAAALAAGVDSRAVCTWHTTRRTGTVRASSAASELPESTPIVTSVQSKPKAKRPIAAAVMSWVARKIIMRCTRMVAGLAVDVGARSNGDVLAGNLPKIKASFDQVFLESLQITGGGNMEITGLDIKLLTLLLARRLNVIRRPFEIFGEYVLTQDDVSNSKLIRDLIQSLVDMVLRALFPSLHLTFFDVSVDKVKITDHKLAIHGRANVAESPSGMSFVLLTGVGLSGEGHVIFLDRPELILNPEAKLPLRVPLGSIRAFDVDIGDNARIEQIIIDDETGVTIKARTLITPAPPFQVSDVGKRAAFLYDLGAFLSSFWGFTSLAEYQLDA